MPAVPATRHPEARHFRPRFVPARSSPGNPPVFPPHHSPPREGRVTSYPTTPKPKLLDQVRAAIRLRHYSLRTEDTYLHWIKRFIFFHGKRHPAEMGKQEIRQFLSALAAEQHVSASTQNQALNALLFLYRYVLDLNPGSIDNLVRAKQPHRLPVVLRKHEYRYDEQRQKRLKTVELIIAEEAWTPFKAPPPADVLVPLRIAPAEVTLRQQVKQLGGRWDPRRQVWEIRYGQAVALGLAERILDSKGL